MLSQLKLSIACSMLLIASSFARTWTDNNGRKFEAALIRLEGDKVLLNVGGRQRSFKLNQLAAADQVFVQGGGRSTRTPVAPVPVAPRRTTPTRRGSSGGQIQADTTIKVERLRVEPDKKRWVYGSPNFEFICDDDLGLATVRKFAWMFESIWQFCGNMSFDIPRLRAQQKVRMKIYLIKEYADYVRAGGSPNSGGVYIPSQDVVLVPFRSLDLGSQSGERDTNTALRHEVTHQLMTGQSQQAGWFIEGSAEYVATVPFDKTRLLTDRHLKSVVAYVSAYGWTKRQGHNLGNSITFARLESFMQPSYTRFQRQENAYAYALVLYTYFAKLDGQKKGEKLAQYVAALQDGRPEVDARKFLLAGRSYEELEKDVISAWNLQGLRLKFK